MTIKEASETLNGEGSAYENPQPHHMQRMLDRLARLKHERRWALENLPEIVKGYNDDIAGQIRAIERAVRINPALLTMTCAALAD